MFNDRYGLTDAVLEGRKTMTRRIIKTAYEDVKAYHANGGWHFIGDIEGESFELTPQYQIGETVAIAQRYESIYLSMSANVRHKYSLRVAAVNHTGDLYSIAGWRNKMFVKANLMTNRIRITDIKVERLQDISEEDCLKEGIVPVTWRQYHKQALYDLSPQRYTDHHVWTLEKFREGLEDPWAESDPDEYMGETPQVAFAVLIDLISGKGTWESNPWVFVYEFELVR